MTQDPPGHEYPRVNAPSDRLSTIRRVSPYEGVDRDAVAQELENFVRETEPVRDPDMFSHPRCGDDRALELEERVRPILDALYPRWGDENPGSAYVASSSERSACMRLLARLRTSDEIEQLLGGADLSPRLAASALHDLVWRAASVQWETGHRHDAVIAAAKAVDSLLQKKLSRRDSSEVKLVQEAFSEKEPQPGKPRLRFPEIEDDQTRDSTREGAMSFGVGCFKAIRHPVGHRPDDEIELSEQEALERLAALSLFARWIDKARVVEAE